MLHVDVLSGYLICGASALVGAAMLRIAEPNDERTRAALRVCGLGLVVLGLSLLPAGLGPAAVAQMTAQLSLAFGTLAGMVLIGSGLGHLQGRNLGVLAILALIIVSGVATGSAWTFGPYVFGQVFAGGLLAIASLMLWLTRGFVTSPRDVVERAMGLTMVVLVLTAATRLVFTLLDPGPPRHDLMYVPSPLRDVLAALYGVLPMVVATLLLSLVNSRLRHQLRTRAITDELTGTMTRRALRELAPALMERHQSAREVAVLMLDLDRFKVINDTYGHHTGDAVLQLAAAVLQTHLRGDALLARYGGEEFVAVVPVEDLPSARRVAERLRHAIETAAWRSRLQLTEGVTVSVGVALLGPAESLDTALKRADEGLYRAKRDGRNQCQFGLAVAGSA